jgi:hypothetical protein
MANGLDAFEGAQLQLSGIVLADAVQVAVHELDGLEQTSRHLAFPDLAETSLTERFHKPVARKRLRVSLFLVAHLLRSLSTLEKVDFQSTPQGLRNPEPAAQ